jgi:hypothetical protein
MTYQEICNGKLIIINPVPLPFNCQHISKYISEKAFVILEDMHDGTYTVLKNRYGDVGEVVTQKEITKFMLRY